MASGNGTKIHRRLPSGEDLQTTLLAIILGPSWRNLATGDVGLTSQPRLRGSGSSFFGQEPPPPSPPPSSLQEAFRSSEADPPLNPTLYHDPWFQETKAPAGQHRQKGPKAQECSNDEWVLPSPLPGIARDLPL